LTAASTRGLPPRPPPPPAAAATLRAGPNAPPSSACRAPTTAPGCVRRSDAAPLDAVPTVCAPAAEEAVARPSTCHRVGGDAAAVAWWASLLAVAAGGRVAVTHTTGDRGAGSAGNRDGRGKDASGSPAAAPCAWRPPDHDVPPVDGWAPPVDAAHGSVPPDHSWELPPPTAAAPGAASPPARTHGRRSAHETSAVCGDSQGSGVADCSDRGDGGGGNDGWSGGSSVDRASVSGADRRSGGRAINAPLCSAGTGQAAAAHGVSPSVVHPPADVVHEPTAAAAASAPTLRQSPKAREPDSVGGASVNGPAADGGAVGASYSSARHDGAGAGAASGCPWRRNAKHIRWSVQLPTIVANGASLL